VPHINIHNGLDATLLADSGISLTINRSNCTHSCIRCVSRSL